MLLLFKMRKNFGVPKCFFKEAQRISVTFIVFSFRESERMLGSPNDFFTRAERISWSLGLKESEGLLVFFFNQSGKNFEDL